MCSEDFVDALTFFCIILQAKLQLVDCCHHCLAYCISTTCSQFHSLIPTPLKINFVVCSSYQLVRMATIGDTTTKNVYYTYSLAMMTSILTKAYTKLQSVKCVTSKYNVPPNQLCKWKRHFDDNGDLTRLVESSKGVRVS
jgi:hypothetical protein